MFEELRQNPDELQERTMKSKSCVTERQLEKIIPKIKSFAEKNYVVIHKKLIAVCKVCGSQIMDGFQQNS